MLRKYNLSTLFILVAFCATGLTWWQAFTNSPKWYECDAIRFRAPVIPAEYDDNGRAAPSFLIWAGEPVRNFSNGRELYLDAFEFGWQLAVAHFGECDTWEPLENEFFERLTISPNTWGFEHYQNAKHDGYVAADIAIRNSLKLMSVTEIQRQLDEPQSPIVRFALPAIITTTLFTGGGLAWLTRRRRKNAG